MKDGCVKRWRSRVGKPIVVAAAIVWLAMITWWLGSYFVQTKLTVERDARLSKNGYDVPSMDLRAGNGTITILLKHENYGLFAKSMNPLLLNGEWRKAEKNASGWPRTWAHYFRGFGWEHRIDVKEPFRGVYVGPPIPDYSESFDLTAPMWALPAITSFPLIVIAILRLMTSRAGRRCGVCGVDISPSIGGACARCGVTRRRAFLSRLTALAMVMFWIFASFTWISSYFAPTFGSGALESETWGMTKFDRGLMMLMVERDVLHEDHPSPHAAVLLLDYGISAPPSLEPIWPRTHWGFGGDYQSAIFTHPRDWEPERTLSLKVVTPIPLYWVLCTLALIALFRWRRRTISRVALNCCSTCGYDLTANESGICPECGTPAPA